MLIIRFARRGRTKRPFYDLVIAEKARAVQKKFIAKLGYYDPLVEGGKGKFVFDADAVAKYVGHGAAVSETAARRLTKAGVQGLEKYMPKRKTVAPKPAEAKEDAE